MLYPSSISLATVTLDPGFLFFGEDTRLEVEVRADLPGPFIKHTSHWARMENGDSVASTTGRTFTVPVVGQRGWRDEDGKPVTTWSYRVHVLAEAPGRSPVRWYGSVTPTTATPNATITPATGTLTGVAGATGATVNPTTGAITGTGGGTPTITEVQPGVYEIGAA